MPTKVELDNLLSNCTVAWTNVNGMNGRKFTGKGAYASNSVFLPAAGYSDNPVPGDSGYYWSSTPTPNESEIVYNLYFTSSTQGVSTIWSGIGSYSVRAVLAEED